MKKSCAYAIIDDKNRMIKHLKKAIKNDPYFKVTAKFDPDFVDYKNDPDFNKLVND